MMAKKKILVSGTYITESCVLSRRGWFNFFSLSFPSLLQSMDRYKKIGDTQLNPNRNRRRTQRPNNKQQNSDLVLGR